LSYHAGHWRVEAGVDATLVRAVQESLLR
jgi:hypothetical protein